VHARAHTHTHRCKHDDSRTHQATHLAPVVVLDAGGCAAVHKGVAGGHEQGAPLRAARGEEYRARLRARLVCTVRQQHKPLASTRGSMNGPAQRLVQHPEKASPQVAACSSG